MISCSRVGRSDRLNALIFFIVLPIALQAGEESNDQAADQRMIKKSLVSTLSAETIAPMGTSMWSRTFVDIRVNDEDRGEYLALVNEDEIAIKSSDAKTLGVLDGDAKGVFYANTRYIVVSTLASEIHSRFNLHELRLDLTLPPERLYHEDVDATQHRSELPPQTYTHSAALSYQIAGGNTPSAFADLTTTAGRLRFESSTSVVGHRVYRGLSNATFESRSRLYRSVVGDSVVAADDQTGGSPIIGGIASTRATDLDPTIVRYPTPTLMGRTLTPSTADVYVNGILVREVELPPGTFDVRNIPIPGGTANADVRIRDAYGNTVDSKYNIYESPTSLRHGLHDFTYALGAKRIDAFSASDRYADGVAIARYRYGLSDTLTAGGRLDQGMHQTSYGPNIDLRMPFGLIHAGAGVSRAEGVSGRAATFSYSYSGRTLSLSATTLAQSKGYTTSSQSIGDDRALCDTNATLGKSLGRRTTGSLTLDNHRMRDSPSSSSVALALETNVHERSTLSVTATKNRDSGAIRSSYGVYARLGWSLTRTDTVSETSTLQGKQRSEGFAFQHTRPTGYGIGYSADLTSGVNATNVYRSEYHGPNFDLQGYGSSIAGSPATNHLLISGSIVSIGDRTFFSSPFGDAFALVRTPGLGGSLISLDNQVVGKTDARGEALIPNLHANAVNTLAVDETKLPLSVALETATRVVAPYIQEGAIVDFPVRRLQAFVGSVRLFVSNRDTSLESQTLELSRVGRHFDSLIGENGRFYFENLAVGEYTASVALERERCRFSLVVPASNALRVNLGAHLCRAQ